MLTRRRGRQTQAGTGRERFDYANPRVRHVLALAQEEARRLHHSYIGAEHLLLGLLREGEGIAARALTGAGVDHGVANDTVVRLLGRGGQSVAGEMCLTDRLKQVLELAGEEARSAGEQRPGVEHLLLGVIRQGDNVGLQVLTALGVEVGPLRTRIGELAGAAGRAAAPGGVKGNVVMCRVDDQDLAAIDALIEAGVRSTRSDAASWLIHAGIAANAPLLESVQDTVADIRRLREEARRRAQQVIAREHLRTPEPGASAREEDKPR